MKIAASHSCSPTPPTPVVRAERSEAPVDAYGPSRPELEGIYKPSQLARLFSAG